MNSIFDASAEIKPRMIPNYFITFTTKHPSGIGVGLRMSKNIVKAHGGRIWSENNSHGTGATYAFTLPSTN